MLLEKIVDMVVGVLDDNYLGERGGAANICQKNQSVLRCLAVSQ